MTACIIGTILEINKPFVIIEDKSTKEVYTCEPEGDLILDLKQGDSGIFVGQYYNNRLKVKRIELRQFLDPLAETELNEASGMFTLIPVIDDPFTEAYIKYREKQNELHS